MTENPHIPKDTADILTENSCSLNQRVIQTLHIASEGAHHSQADFSSTAPWLKGPCCLLEISNAQGTALQPHLSKIESRADSLWLISRQSRLPDSIKGPVSLS